MAAVDDSQEVHAYRRHVTASGVGRYSKIGKRHGTTTSARIDEIGESSEEHALLETMAESAVRSLDTNGLFY